MFVAPDPQGSQFLTNLQPTKYTKNPLPMHSTCSCFCTEQKPVNDRSRIQCKGGACFLQATRGPPASSVEIGEAGPRHFVAN
mmetsp:Transcript_9004/g.13803  ORF Transcript_9004/g.13803 Transcript_9004/m.13803 type:complete len:82 (-) Transcript_9004:1266-1511(-)